VITEDEATRLLKRADPARADDGVPIVDAAGYLAALRTRSTTVTLIDTEPNPSRPKHRHRWPIIAVAAAAVVVVVVGALVLAARDDATDLQIPAGPSTTLDPDPSAAEAEEIARGFLDAYISFDADRAITYLTDDALAEAFESPEAMRLELAFFEAQPYNQRILDCEQQGDSAAGTSVRCSFDFHVIRSDEIGLGPYGDNFWDLVVRDGMIVSAENTVAFLTNGFSREMWVPFANWVAAEHPDDVLRMYESEGRTEFLLSEESVQLWEQRSREYVQAVLTRREAYPADVGAICATQAARLGELAVPAEGALDQVAAWNAAAAAIMEQAHGELIVLDMPPVATDDTMAYTSFYNKLIRLVRIAKESAEAATAGDSTRLAELDAVHLQVRRAMMSGPVGSGLEKCLESLPS
jgi:hypothetical protein